MVIVPLPSADLVAWLAMGCVAAGVIAAASALKRGAPTRLAFFAALETGLTVALGALTARTFVWLLLAAGGATAKSVFAIGSLFLFWPGLLDALGWIASGRTVFDAEMLLHWAAASGALVGFWDGLHQIHRWGRNGGVPFLLDVTWGGAATNLGLLIHFLNAGWSRPLNSRRLEAHCYDGGVFIAPDYAFALGNVCGNLRGRGDGPLFCHEQIHVLQNRIFGPAYLFTYVLWTIGLFLPALAWGLVVGRPSDVVYSWCYANNPWEAWAYRYGGSRPPHLVWPTERIMAVASILI